MHRAEQRLETDVLVIGGAAAGLTAALEARAQGVSVVVAAKSRAGRSGNTVVAGCQFCAVVPYPGSEDSPERHFQDSLAGGQEVNDEILLHLLTSRGGPSLLRLEEWGVRLLRSGGELVRRTPGGHSRARGIVTDNGQYSASVGGLSITLPLRSAAERAGVSFLDGVPILRLISSGGRVCGAVGIDVEKGDLVLIRASAVIVAAGGAGHIYENTNNTRGISGDSYGLLLESGATLTDMEFVQFYPTQMTQPFKIAVASPLFGDGAVLRNRHGERFMPSYDPVREDRTTRDVMSRAIFSEVQRGNGVDGEVYMDCTRVPEGVLQEKYSTLVRDLRKQGVDPSRDWVKVGCTTHFFMGGARVDERCATGVPGLFAAGEAAGGVHGANRLAGNALTEAIVFGPIAGKAAGEYARLNPGGPESSVSSLELEGGLGGRESLDAVRADLRRAMWRDASIVRSDSSLRRALAEVRECAERVTRCPAADLAAVARREETRLMALAAEAVVLSALARLESRGAHFREDYPSREDPWLGSHHLSLSEGRLQLRFVAKQPNRG